jgi:hypothetical protein
MSKSEGEHDKTKQIITKKEDFKSSWNPPNLFIDIPIVAEVERFRSTGVHRWLCKPNEPLAVSSRLF